MIPSNPTAQNLSDICGVIGNYYENITRLEGAFAAMQNRVREMIADGGTSGSPFHDLAAMVGGKSTDKLADLFANTFETLQWQDCTEQPVLLVRVVPEHHLDGWRYAYQYTLSILAGRPSIDAGKKQFNVPLANTFAFPLGSEQNETTIRDICFDLLGLNKPFPDDASCIMFRIITDWEKICEAIPFEHGRHLLSFYEAVADKCPGIYIPEKFDILANQRITALKIQILHASKDYSTLLSAKILAAHGRGDPSEIAKQIDEITPRIKRLLALADLYDITEENCEGLSELRATFDPQSVID